uniref:Uncharacterized protein n=1 Tax=Picea sitchensis TaxID=3332 RepID=A0A6B9XYE0_PICSI|nr:hypothetical protein Q903MT_gene5672 [Picea sitchensis]
MEWMDKKRGIGIPSSFFAVAQTSFTYALLLLMDTNNCIASFLLRSASLLRNVDNS